MEATRLTHARGIPCALFDGPRASYQTRAAREIYATSNLAPGRFSWIVPTCGTEMCIEPAHLQVNAPLAINYPWNLCTYCGVTAWTKDHLLPRSWTGDVVRKWTATVPACGECNSAISDRLAPCINDRRALAHRAIRRKHAAALRTLDRTPAQILEYGPTLRTTIKAGMAKKADALRRLSWPTDPFYDLRAFQDSGIENPYALGLLRLEMPPDPIEGVA